jgi:integrase/recombinase XerD
MSHQAIAAALVCADLSVGERLVAFSLASFADRDSLARPGYDGGGGQGRSGQERVPGGGGGARAPRLGGRCAACDRVQERGLRERTVLEQYEPTARLFLSGRQVPEGLALGDLDAGDVSTFLASELPKHGVDGARCMASGLRCLLRYLRMVGLTRLPLEWAVPGIADLRDRSLPRGLEPAVVAKLLACCDRRRTVGRRDYAILLLLCRMGLRRGEVAGLTLDDIDWRRGEILVRGKGGRQDVLPLPIDVGEAIVSYLRRRPLIDSRSLFLRVHAPAGPLRPSGVLSIVRAACRRAGLPLVGAHQLWHTAATEMLRGGASLGEIGQVLRHRDLRTTARYAKVDRARLRKLARPWPEGGAA